MQTPFDKYLREKQHGYRPGRSCTNLIFTLWILIDDTREWQNKMYMAFIDFENTFDSLHHETLWKLLTF